MYNYAFVRNYGQERAETVKRKSAFFHLGMALRWTDKDKERRHQGSGFPHIPLAEQCRQQTNPKSADSASGKAEGVLLWCLC